MMLHFYGMILVIITCVHAHAADFSQRRETNTASLHSLASEQWSSKEPLSASGIGHLKFFVELRPKEKNDGQELFVPKVRRRRDLSTIIDDILHSGHYHHMYPPNLDFLTQLKHSADSGTLTSLIGSMGYSFVLKLMENLTPTDAHKLNSAILKRFSIYLETRKQNMNVGIINGFLWGNVCQSTREKFEAEGLKFFLRAPQMQHESHGDHEHGI